MVVFTCNHCGDSLHKPSVEKHYNYVCRTVKSLTCVDCLKDFRAEEYVTHTKCLTEDERYAAKGSMTVGIAKKGEAKQESWVEMIKSILDKEPNMKASHRNLLNTISGYNNIPRKKPKFLNFIKSSSGGRANMKEVEEVWNIIEKYKNDQVKEQQAYASKNIPKAQENNDQKDNKDAENSKRKAESEDTEIPKKKKKKKHNEAEEQLVNDNIEATQNTDEPQTERFSFQSKILDILIDKGNISLRKLEKKVINAYLKHLQETQITPKLVKKFNKKLKKIPNIEISDDRVTLIQNSED